MAERRSLGGGLASAGGELVAAAATRFVRLETNYGVVELELYTDHAPRTCRNFAELARSGYYSGTIFHRVIRNFMAQGGDPTGTGRGGESIYGGKFEDEIHPELKHTGAGVLSSANAGPNTNGSQFFITLAPAPHLDGKHTIFGRVCGGIDVVKKIGEVRADKSDRPVEHVTIHRAVASAAVGASSAAGALA